MYQLLFILGIVLAPAVAYAHGWYLLVPWEMLVPLDRWRQVSSHDTAAGCEEARKSVIQHSRQITERIRARWQWPEAKSGWVWEVTIEFAVRVDGSIQDARVVWAVPLEQMAAEADIERQRQESEQQGAAALQAVKRAAPFTSISTALMDQPLPLRVVFQKPKVFWKNPRWHEAQCISANDPRLAE